MADNHLDAGAPGPVDLDDELELPPAPADELEAPAPTLTEDKCRRFARGVGSFLNVTIGDDDVPEHWRFRDDELDAIAPALLLIAQNRPQVAQAIERSDYAFGAFALFGYGARNIKDQRNATKARRPLNGLEFEDGWPGGIGMAGAAGNGQADPDGGDGVRESGRLA